MERISKFRAFLLMALFLVVLVLFSFKLFGLQVGQTNTNISNVTTYSTITRVKAARGDITDRNGNILVGNRASYDLVFNHYVIISSDNTNESLVKLIDKCGELGVKYNDHFPVTRTRPFEYTLDNYSAAWRGYFQSFLSDDWCGLDSDITAPLLIQKLRDVYKIPSDWSDEDARAVIGLRYELDLRNVTNLSSYIFIEDVSDENLAVLLELNVPGLMVEASTVREYHTK
jgi:penicillin-binding protein 2